MHCEAVKKAMSRTVDNVITNVIGTNISNDNCDNCGPVQLSTSLNSCPPSSCSGYAFPIYRNQPSYRNVLVADTKYPFVNTRSSYKRTSGEHKMNWSDGSENEIRYE